MPDGLWWDGVLNQDVGPLGAPVQGAPGAGAAGLGGVGDAVVMEHTDRQEVGQGPRHLWKQGNDDLGKGGVSKPLFFYVQLIHDKCGFCGGRHAC